MNVQVIGYRNYGVLGYEKQPFYTINRPSPLAVVSEKVIFSLPEKWKTARNQAGTILIESPDGRTWIAEQILVNRHRGNEQPRLDVDGFKFYLGVEPLTIEKPIPEPIKKEPCQIIGIQFPLEDGISLKNVIRAVSKMDCDGYDFYRVDGEASSAYFVFNSDVYTEFLKYKLLPAFDIFIQGILNDVDLESKSDYYQFEGYKFWFGYELQQMR